MFAFTPGCADAGLRVVKPIRIARDGTFAYSGRIEALPSRRRPRASGPVGTAKITGRFTTSRRMTATVVFDAERCRGHFTHTLRFTGRA
jgi:hypothetical protein